MADDFTENTIPNDPRDFIERTLSRSVSYEGREMTPAEMAQMFAVCDEHQRVGIMEEIKVGNGNDISVREAARRLPYVRALRNKQEALRKAGIR